MSHNELGIPPPSRDSLEAIPLLSGLTPANRPPILAVIHLSVCLLVCT